VANLFTSSPDDAQDIVNQGVSDIARLALPGFPGAPASSSTSTTTTADTSKPTLNTDTSRAAPTPDDIAARAKQLGVDPKLALSIFGLESGGNFKSRDSGVGAVGGMQVMPDTYKQMMGTYSGQRDPWNNMEAGLRYLAYGQKTLGTTDPALIAAGYQAGYGNPALKSGQIPDTTDGGMTTKQYAANIVKRMGLGGPSPTYGANASSSPAVDASNPDPSRYTPLTADQVAQLQSQSSNPDPTRYQPLTTADMDKLPASAFSDVAQPTPATSASSPGFLGTVSDLTREAAGGVYKGIGQALRGTGEAVAMLGDYTTTPIINHIFGTNKQTPNLLAPAADAVEQFAQRVQNGVSQVGQSAVQGSQPGGKLLDPKTWTLGTNPSVRGYALMGSDLIGSFAPMIIASYATGGSAAAGATVGAIQGGGGAAEQAGEAVKQMAADGSIAQNSAYYRHLIQQGVDPKDAVQQTADAAGRWAFMLNAPLAAAGGAAASKILHPATEIASQLPLAGRIASRAALSSADMGAQNAALQVATNVGTNQGAGTNIDPTTGVVGAAASGMIGGLVPGAVGGALSARVPKAPPVEPGNFEVVDDGPSAASGAPAPSGAPALPAPDQGAPTAAAPADVPPPSGPIGRAMQDAAAASPEELAPGAAAKQSQRDSGQVIVGDDGKPYRITTSDGGVTVEPVDESELTPLTDKEAKAAAQPEPAPGAPTPSADVQAAAPSAPTPKTPDKPLSEWTEDDLRDRLRYLTKQAKLNGGWNTMLTTERRKVSVEIDARNAGISTEAKPVTASPVEQPSTSGSSSTLTPEQVTAGKQDALYPRVLDMLQGRDTIKPQDVMAATDVGYNRAARALETAQAEGHVGPVQADGSRKVMIKEANDAAGTGSGEVAVRSTENGATPSEGGSAASETAEKPNQAPANDVSGQARATAGSSVSGADQAANEQPALKDQYTGKWFGSQEKAQAFLDKKKAGDTHEIVQTGKVRFEIKPKVAEGMERFAPESGTLGIPRAEMPQVPAQSHGALVNHLNAQGIKHETKMVPADELKPTQAEFSPEKVEAAKEATGDRAVIVSNDGHIIDGHHQALAAQEEGKDVKAIVLDAPVDKALEAVKNSPSVQTAEEVQARTPEADRAAALEYVRAAREKGATAPDQVMPGISKGRTFQTGAPLVKAGHIMVDAPKGNQFRISDLWKETEPAEQVYRSMGDARDALKKAGPDTHEIVRVARGMVVRPKEGVAPSPKQPVIVRKAGEGAHAIVIDPSAARAEAVNETPAEPTPPTGGEDRFANNKVFTSDAVAKARERLKSKLSGSQLNSGIDPEIVMDGMTIAGAYIESGVRDFAAYAKAMTEDLGDAVKPYLLSFWEAARNFPGLNAEGMTSVDESKRQHAALLTPEVKAGAAEAIGEPVEKPAKRARKTGSAADRTLTQDWGVDHIDGYDGNEATKDAFLKEGRDYLRSVVSQLAEHGYSPLPDDKGRPRKAVSVNEAGPAVSGEVSLSLYNPEIGRGIYAQISGTSLRGAVPHTPSGVSILFRSTTEGDPYGARSTNRWAPTDLSAADLATLLDREARSAIAKQSAPDTMPSKEVVQNDRNATERNSDQGATEQGAGRVSPDAGGRVAENVDEQLGRDNAGSDQRGAAERGGRDRVDEQPAVRGESADQNEGDQLGAEVGRGDGAVAGDRNDRGPVTRVGNDYRIQPGELTRTGSWRSTAEQNVRAVELVKQLEQEGRRPTPEEASLLSKFNGWGASEIANGIFPNQYGRYKDATWQALGERLKGALTPAEYEQAKRTTQYAHYTSEGVVRSIYDALQRLGFAGGKMLEPGMGVGRFKGLMPDSMSAMSQYTGVEYDGLTGAIAKLLYPQSNIIVGDFTKTAMPREFFDAAIGNPPFSSTVITNDPEYKKQGFMLHDYFFAKTIDRVKPGGLVTFITSKGTMDKANDRARRYLADRANLLGAIRLPQTAFKDNAGTEVVTDVLFLQKRGDGIPDNGVKWLGTAEVQTPQGPAQINQYFADHPEMVLGSHALTGSMYRANEYTVLPEPGADMDQAFARAVANLPEGVYQPGAKNPAASKAVALQRDFNPMHKKEGGLYVGSDGKLMQVESGSGVEMTHRRGSDGKEIALKPADKAFLKSWTVLRDALKQAQLDQLSDGDWETSLKSLASTYDQFVAKHGNLLAYSTIERTLDDGTTTVSKRFKNDPLLRLDVEGALAYSLEHIKESGEIVKAPVLSERVLQQPREPEIKTTNDALFVSLNSKGALDLDHVASLAKMSRQDTIDALGTAIYEDPSKGWQTSDAYLSGNVVRKLREAEAAARSDKRFARNVDALLAVQPKPLGPSEITVKLGQNWIPTSDVEAFAREALNENIGVDYNSRLNSWSAEQRGSNYSEYNTPKLNAGQILDSVLNNRQIKVTFKDPEGKTVLDPEMTEKANDVAQKMRAAFARWIWTDPKRSDRLVNYYNDNFNNIAPRQFDGSHLTLPGVSMRFDLYPHQKRAIWRAIQDGDTYLAHAVGAGKTFTMIASGMEERRLGLSNKPMYAVPNHMLAQFAREFLELYPAANIMVADDQNFHTHNRRRFVAQAALNNPDAIIITHSAFGRIGMSDEYASNFIRDQIAEWQTALDEADKGDRITRKQIERRIEQLERRLEARQGGDKKDKVLSFEELGVDRLFVDEGHEFRKLDFATNQGAIKGIDPDGSQRAMDLFMKVNYLREKNPGRALVMASGTPITNTMGELYTVQRLFQPEQLAQDGLDSFDAWSNQYGDIVAGFEQNAAGGYEIVNRFAKFQNVPELMRRVRSFMDILTSSNLGELVQRPAVEGGGRQIMVTPEPFGYKAYQKALEDRINKIRQRKGPPKKGDDIILKVIADGRFSAIDMRFVDPTAPADPNSKLNQMLDAVIKDYHAASDFQYTTNGKVDPIKGASHIIFSDIGLGEQSAANRGFDMKDWIEKRLTEGGVPREQIAFMRDYKQHAKKGQLFADMREGKKRILIGGKDMETGTNVQKRLYTEEHLDAPWFPASVEQREGRIIRQGNQNKEVRIRAWATKGSYDSTMWGMNGRKARFIEQALNGDDSVRSLEDVSEASAFDMAAALASGDERYMKLAGLKADVDRLERLASAHHDEQNKLRRDQHWASTSIERDTALADQLRGAIAMRTPIRAGEFDGLVGKTRYDKRDEFSGAIFNRFKELASTEADTEEQIGEIGGFPIKFYGTELKGSGEYTAAVSVDLPGDPPALIQLPLDPDMPVGGIATRAANQVNALDRQLFEAEGRIAQNKRRVEQIGNRLGAHFPEQAELLDKMAQLNSLEAELTSEKAAENAPAPSADAAIATLDAEGEKPPKTGDTPKYSVGSEVDRNQVVTVTRISTFDVSPDDLYTTANAYYRENLRGTTVDNPQIGTVEFTKDGGGKLLSVGRREPLHTSIVRALPGLVENAVPVRIEDDRKGRDHIAGYVAAIAPVEIDGKIYSVELKLRKIDGGGRDGKKTIFYTLAGFEIGEGGDGRSNPKIANQGQPATASQPDQSYAAAAVSKPDTATTPNRALTVGDLLDAVNWEKRAFSTAPSPEGNGVNRSNVIMGDAEANRKAFSRNELGTSLKSGPLGRTVSDLIGRGSVVLHDTVGSLPGKDAPASTRGVTMPDGTIHLVAANLTPETALGTLLHEAFHQGGEKLIGTAAWSDLMSRLDSLHRQAQQSSGRAREFYDQARERVASAQQLGVIPDEIAPEEFGAYTVEHYDQAPGAFRKWVDDVIGAVKAWVLRRFGKQLGDVTPAELHSIAAAALRDNAEAAEAPRYSVGGNAPGASSGPDLTPPEPTRFERLQAAVQDNMNRVKKVQERIKKLTGANLGYDDYYRAETIRPGRIAARLEDVKTKMFEPLMADLAKSGHKPAELEELLHAQHAQERNERVAEINKDMPDGGSGMTTADAKAILAKYSGATALHDIAQKARDIARATLDLKLEYGLITQEDHDALSKAYKNYVPLKGDGEYGPKVKRAMGHEERDEHILENIARDYDQAVVVGEKNLARQSLLALIANHPDPDLWTIGVPPRGRYVAGKVYNVVDMSKAGGETVGSFTSRSQVNAFLEGAGPAAMNYHVLDSNGERVAEFVKPLQDNEVMVYVKGEPVRIQINDEALARQVRPLDQGRMHPILEMMRGMNRYLSKIYTGYNPAFILRNTARDALTGTVNMVGNEGAGVAAKAWTKYPGAAKALAQWAATGNAPRGKMGDYLNEYRAQGGKTGASWMSDLEEHGKSLTRMYDDAYGASGYLKDGENLKAAQIAGRKIVHGMAHVVEIGNTATENALRLALYAELRDRGAKPGVAAQAAKNVTVDFDRKGTMTGALGAIYLFLNPAIQGTANALRTVASGKHRGQALVALGMLATLGFFAGSKGMDDDKDRWLGQGWDTRSKNFILGIGNHTLKVPVSQEFSPAYAAGVAMAEAMRGQSAMTSAARMVSTFLDAYFPVNGVYSPDSDNHLLDAFLASTPTVIKPLAETAANRNSFGSPIVPDSESMKAQPDNLKMYRSTKGSVYDTLAQSIAMAGELAGANRYENDLTKISPETLKYIWRTYAGGLGQFVTDSIGAANLASQAPGSMSSNDVPIAKDFWQENDVRPIRSQFYNVMNDAKDAQNELIAAKKARDGDAMQQIIARPGQAELLAANKVFTSTNKAVSAIRDQEVAVNSDPKLSIEQKREATKTLEAQEEQLERGALNAFSK
jgi:N12 class adenine-specific DNA methylase